MAGHPLDAAPPRYRSCPERPFGELPEGAASAVRRSLAGTSPAVIATAASAPAPPAAADRDDPVDPASDRDGLAPGGSAARAAASAPPGAAGEHADQLGPSESGPAAAHEAIPARFAGEGIEAASRDAPATRDETPSEPAPRDGRAHRRRRAPVRGRRFPRFVDDGDGYALPRLPRQLSTALGDDELPPEPAILAPPAASLDARQPHPCRWAVRGMLFILAALIIVGALAIPTTLQVLRFLFAAPPLAAALATACVGALGRDGRRAPAIAAAALAALLLLADVLLFLAVFR